MHPQTRKRNRDDDSSDSGDGVPKRPRLALPLADPHPPPANAPTTVPAPANAPAPAPLDCAHAKYTLYRRSSLPGTLLSPQDSPLAAPDPDVTALASQLPPVTQDSLRELELDTILNNPQLRHDLLFDPGLQFRPSATQHKQIWADAYWDALAQELAHTCTCPTPTCASASSSKLGRRPPTPPPWSDRYGAYLRAATVPGIDEPPRPSRLPVMLSELIAVLTSVMIPPPLAVAPPAAEDARALLDHIDPALITQELRRGIYDPAGLFALIGTTLKRHCAPMRDRLVDAMTRAAAEPNVPLTTRALRAIRLCFELLELMKLDIANHQLQHLRSFLTASTPEYELRHFIERCRRNTAPRITRAWLKRAWDPSPRIETRTLRIQASLVRAVCNLVFDPAPRPETLYLDAARITVLQRDAADLTALYLLIMLWRQLVFWGGAARRTSLEDWEVDRIKREIWQVGPRRMGSCFGEQTPEAQEAWRSAMRNVAALIALRAEEAREPPAGRPLPGTPLPKPKVPSKDNYRLMYSWICSHLHRRSAPFAVRLRTLLRAEAVRTAAPLAGLHTEIEPPASRAGLEPLAPEIRHLAQRVAKLVVVNMRVYWSLYSSEGFLIDADEPEGAPVE